MFAALPVFGLAFLQAVHLALSAFDDGVSVSLNGDTYVNKGLVGFGLIPSNFRESTGDTIGGIGSAIAIELGSWQVNTDGTFAGTFIVHPDRGFNVYVSLFFVRIPVISVDSDGTIDYQARTHNIDFVLNPYYGDANLTFADAQKTLNLTYISTLLEFDRNHTNTSGLDALAVRPAQKKSVTVPLPDPQMPIPSLEENHLTIDAEGIVVNTDGTHASGPSVALPFLI